jgi:uncharacterized membrane protein YjjP (DUF1212 family)
MDGFDVAVRVARLGQACSAEGVEMLERYVRRAATAYGTEVVLVVLPEQVVVQEDRDRPRLVVVRSAPGIFRLDQVGALKRALVEIESGMSAADACRRLDEITAQGPRWPGGSRPSVSRCSPRASHPAWSRRGPRSARRRSSGC